MLQMLATVDLTLYIRTYVPRKSMKRVEWNSSATCRYSTRLRVVHARENDERSFGVRAVAAIDARPAK
jgi:hypothetical protein